jgi:hypothetical protein
MPAELMAYAEPLPARNPLQAELPHRASGLRRRVELEEIIVARNGQFFFYGGRFVELAARMQLARVLLALCNAHVAHPGEWIDCFQLIDEAWQGERMAPASAMNRLHVAIAMLRKIGLRPVLESKKGAYRFRADVVVVIAEDASQKGIAATK